MQLKFTLPSGIVSKQNSSHIRTDVFSVELTRITGIKWQVSTHYGYFMESDNIQQKKVIQQFLTEQGIDTELRHKRLRIPGPVSLDIKKLSILENIEKLYPEMENDTPLSPRSLPTI
jgi:hypothetical protein